MSGEIEIRSLDGIDIEALHHSQTKAFSDYPVDVSMRVDELERLLRQNSVEMSCSVGTFAGRDLVGFWLNGMRRIDNKNAGYDSGTAIWPEHRGRGLSSRMWKKTRELLAAHDVEKYWLEVLQENARAYEIYRQKGFVETRALRCLKANSPKFGRASADGGVSFEEGEFNPKIVASLPAMEYRPSWQNSTESMINIHEDIYSVVAKRGGEVVGFGLLIRERGRLAEFGFAEDCWKEEITHPLLERLFAASGQKEIFVINVNAKAKKSLALLESCGFEDEVWQWEMVMKL